MTPFDGSESSLALVRRYQLGEEEAGYRLIEVYFERVIRIVRLRSDPLPRTRFQTGETFYQTFLAAVRDFTRFELRDDWSFIICLAVLVARRMQDSESSVADKEVGPHRFMPLEFKIKSGRVGVNLVETGTWPNSDIVDSEETLRVEEGICRLSAELKEMVILRNFVGMSWERIAEESGLATAEAARRLHGKAVSQLGEILREDSE